MVKQFHEIRDPIHAFVRLSTDERDVLNSRPFQRLRDVHQLALTYLVYPGATHRRFEHSLGVMELASRIFDVVTSPGNVSDDVRDQLPELVDDRLWTYWRQVVRMAALLHDVGHLPFSHAAEKELLPEGWAHEHLTRAMILDDGVGDILDGMIAMSETLARLPVASFDYVFVEPELQNKAMAWLESNRPGIIKPEEMEEPHGQAQ